MTAGEGRIRLALWVQPRASRNRIVGLHGDRIKLQIAAPPVDGAANAAVVAFVAEWLGVPRRTVNLVRGESSREKTVSVEAEDPEALKARVEATLSAC